MTDKKKGTHSFCLHLRISLSIYFKTVFKRHGSMETSTDTRQVNRVRTAVVV